MSIEITHIRKRDGSTVPFAFDKIERAISRAFMETGEAGEGDALAQRTKKVADSALRKIQDMCAQAPTAEPGHQHYGKCAEGVPKVEEIQDLVELALMDTGNFTTAKAYILFRAARTRKRQRDIFSPRVNIKPYEYPELVEYVSGIRHSYWIHTEFNYTRDIDDYKTRVTDAEREAVKRAMLAVAQIEVSVEGFWGNLYNRIPKPEIGAVGYTFAESEVRHMDAYAHLIDILSLNDEFKRLTDVPVIKKRIEYLAQVNAYADGAHKSEASQSLILFSLFIERVSLFGLFLVIMSFNKHKGIFKGISNVVEATSKEEQIHGMFGIDLINIIRTEHPEWFDASYHEAVRMLCIDAYQAEASVIDWLFEQGELEFLPKAQVKEFIKNRINNSLVSIGLSSIFTVDEALLDQTEWFTDEIIATKHVDFFDKRSINYNKRQTSVTTEDLF